MLHQFTEDTYLLEDTHIPQGVLPDIVELAPNVFFCPMMTGNTGFLVTSEGIIAIDTGYAHDRRSVLRRIRRYFHTHPLRYILCTDTQGGANVRPLLEEAWQSGTMTPTIIAQRNQRIEMSSCAVLYDDLLSLNIGEFLITIHHFENGDCNDGAWIHIVSHNIIFSGTLLQTGSPKERANILSTEANVLLPRFGIPLSRRQALERNSFDPCFNLTLFKGRGSDR